MTKWNNMHTMHWKSNMVYISTHLSPPITSCYKMCNYHKSSNESSERL